ncbi:MAG: signal peptidase II [Opitutales bacterium]|nr:signal peptidase II [Opitutales bacterium]
MATTEKIHAAFRRYPVFIWLTAGVFALDQATKLWIVHLSGLRTHAYPPYGGMEIIPGFLSVVHTTNAGAAWGILEGHSWFLISVAVLALVGIVLFRREIELERRHMQWAFGLMSGGILGNALDRLAYGYVVDFIDVHLQFYRWPTFNVADSGIVAGCALFVWFSFRPPRGDRRASGGPTVDRK